MTSATMRCRSSVRRLSSCAFSPPSAFVPSETTEIGKNFAVRSAPKWCTNFIHRLSGIASRSNALPRSFVPEMGRCGFSLSEIQSRHLAAQASKDDYREEVDEINSKFAEARDDIEMAMESKETVYFDTESQTARASVKEVLDKYEALLARLDEEDKGVIQRSMGLKMEQLKAELKQLDE